MNSARRNILDLSNWGVPQLEIPPISASFPATEPRNEEHNIYDGDLSSSEEEITLQYIIEKKPSTKIVRDFMRANLGVIESEEQKLFG